MKQSVCILLVLPLFVCSPIAALAQVATCEVTIIAKAANVTVEDPLPLVVYARDADGSVGEPRMAVLRGTKAEVGKLAPGRYEFRTAELASSTSGVEMNGTFVVPNAVSSLTVQAESKRVEVTLCKVLATDSQGKSVPGRLWYWRHEVAKASKYVTKDDHTVELINDRTYHFRFEPAGTSHEATSFGPLKAGDQLKQKGIEIQVRMRPAKQKVVIDAQELTATSHDGAARIMLYVTEFETGRSVLTTSVDCHVGTTSVTDEGGKPLASPNKLVVELVPPHGDFLFHLVAVASTGDHSVLATCQSRIAFPHDGDVDVRLERDGIDQAQIKVTDEKGQPVPNATVIVKQHTGRLIDRGKTDLSGHLKTRAIAPGEYVIGVVSRGRAELVRTVQLPHEDEIAISYADVAAFSVVLTYGRQAPSPAKITLVPPSGYQSRQIHSLNPKQQQSVFVRVDRKTTFPLLVWATVGEVHFGTLLAAPPDNGKVVLTTPDRKRADITLHVPKSWLNPKGPDYEVWLCQPGPIPVAVIDFAPERHLPYDAHTDPVTIKRTVPIINEQLQIIVRRRIMDTADQRSPVVFAEAGKKNVSADEEVLLDLSQWEPIFGPKLLTNQRDSDPGE